MNTEKVKQRSQDWLELRRGRFTASEIFKLMGKSFGKELKDWPQTAQSYILEKVAETFSTESQPLTSVEIRWGLEYEPIGLAHYGAIFNEVIEEVGFVLWPENTNCGCSPDGLIKGQSRGIELKCPYMLRNHMDTLLISSNAEFKKCKPQYYFQVMSSMMFCGYDVWDFVSFHPMFKPEQRLAAIEIVKNQSEFDLMAERLVAAVVVRDKLIEKVLSQRF